MSFEWPVRAAGRHLRRTTGRVWPPGDRLIGHLPRSTLAAVALKSCRLDSYAGRDPYAFRRLEHFLRSISFMRPSQLLAPFERVSGPMTGRLRGRTGWDSPSLSAGAWEGGLRDHAPA
jgi:hypothetical protein